MERALDDPELMILDDTFAPTLRVDHRSPHLHRRDVAVLEPRHLRLACLQIKSEQQIFRERRAIPRRSAVIADRAEVALERRGSFDDGLFAPRSSDEERFGL